MLTLLPQYSVSKIGKNVSRKLQQSQIRESFNFCILSFQIILKKIKKIVNVACMYSSRAIRTLSGSKLYLSGVKKWRIWGFPSLNFIFPQQFFDWDRDYGQLVEQINNLELIHHIFSVHSKCKWRSVFFGFAIFESFDLGNVMNFVVVVFNFPQLFVYNFHSILKCCWIIAWDRPVHPIGQIDCAEATISTSLLMNILHRLYFILIHLISFRLFVCFAFYVYHVCTLIGFTPLYRHWLN